LERAYTRFRWPVRVVFFHLPAPHSWRPSIGQGDDLYRRLHRYLKDWL